jgi:hypothetical protein
MLITYIYSEYMLNTYIHLIFSFDFEMIIRKTRH